MPADTDKKLNHLLIYEINTYYFSAQKGFLGIIPELDRLKSLGVDVIWLMPFYPRGVEKKLGDLGSPYCIKDYRDVSPLHGTMSDLESLINETHARGMKFMIDIVFNHTSHDSVLVKAHPEWFYVNEAGERFSRGWKDVIDLDYSHPELWDYMIETLLMWVRKGVDGFRCDVASMVPVEFWKKARAAVAKLNPDHIWLNESLHMSFIRKLRSEGWYCASDGETYDAFDLTYDYDIHNEFEDCLFGRRPLGAYIDALKRQPAMYPEWAIKMRFLENHDRLPAVSIILTPAKLRQWTAFAYFLKGAMLLYNGQEFMNNRRLSITSFDRTIDSDENRNFTDLLKKLRLVKNMDIVADGFFELDGPYGESGVVATYTKGEKRLIGVFNLSIIKNDIPLPIPDGEYVNLIDGRQYAVHDNMIDLPVEPLIFEL